MPPRQRQASDTSVNSNTVPVSQPEIPSYSSDEEGQSHDHNRARHHQSKRSKLKTKLHTSSLPVGVGVILAIAIVVLFAAGTFFFLMRPSDDQRLVADGRKQLDNGQYAFAVRTLEKALAGHPNNPTVLLSLARAYVGVAEIDKARQMILQAQQQGVSITSEPQLASDLANYYRQREQFDKAIELLRPLAQAGITGKRAELADLDALWGDIALRDGDLEKAQQCWEEVKQLGDGTRFSEADSRLATIDQRLADKYVAAGDDGKALSYLTKLNTSVERPGNYEQTAAIYERKGDLEAAIGQYQKALNLYGQGPNADALKQKLATLLERHGKELLDKGDSDSGYGYLQQAKQMDTTVGGGKVALRSVQVSMSGGVPTLKGSIWNPGPDLVNSLTIRADLFDPNSGHVLWQQDRKLIDEYEIPLSADDSRQFQFSGIAVKPNAEFRIFIDGTLYKSYPLTKKAVARTEKPVPYPVSNPAQSNPAQAAYPGYNDGTSASAHNTKSPFDGQASNRKGSPFDPAPARRESSEDKTLKDLDF